MSTILLVDDVLEIVDVLEEIKKKLIPVQVVILTSSLNFLHFVEKISGMGYSKKDVFFKPVNLENLFKHVKNALK